MQPVYASKFLSKLTVEQQERVIKSGIVPINDAFFPYFDVNRRYEIYYGGRGSSKSHFIARKQLKRCKYDKYFKGIYARKHAVDIRDSQFELFKSVASDLNIYKEFSFSESTMRIKHSSGNMLIARGLDEAEKTKSITDPTSLWCEEITEFEQEDFNTANQAIRMKDIELTTTISFNPVHESNWVRSFFFSPDNPHALHERFEGKAILLRTTLKDNYFIDQVAYEKDLEIGAAGNQNILRVAVEGDWGISENGNPWLHAYGDKHIKKVPFLQSFPVYLNFDINNDPFTCVAVQMSPIKGTKDSFIHFVKEFAGHIKVEDMCQQIKSTFPSSIFFLTGDRSGLNEDVGRNQTIYAIIQSLLGLNDKQMNLNTHNLEHADSRLLCNAMLQHYPNLYIDPSCKGLIADCEKATVDPKSSKPSMLLKDRGAYKMDLFDGMRYFFQTYFNVWAKDTYFKVLKR